MPLLSVFVIWNISLHNQCFMGIFFSDFVVIYTGILVHLRNQVTCTVSLLLRTAISVISKYLPFWHWDCCQKHSFSCLPSLGHRICLLCKSSGLLNSLNSLHLCHCCISHGRTEILALTRATWMWMGSATTGKESSFQGPSRKVKAIGGLGCFCWATSCANCLDRSEHTGPFWGTSAVNRWRRAVLAVTNGIAALAEPCCTINPEASDLEVCQLTLQKADLASQCTVPGVQNC